MQSPIYYNRQYNDDKMKEYDSKLDKHDSKLENFTELLEKYDASE